MKSLSWINFILGVGLIIRFAFSLSVSPIIPEEIALGVITAGLAAIAATRSSPIVNWFLTIAAVWTLVAPSAMNYAGLTASRDSDLVVGTAVLVLGVASQVYRRVPLHTHA